MSSATLEKLRSEVLRLPEAERAELAHELMKSLDAPADADAATEWDAETSKRLDQIDAGTAELVDRDELRRRMHDHIRSL
jgi:putative addiction module component (TIGR02574 family)